MSKAGCASHFAPARVGRRRSSDIVALEKLGIGQKQSSRWQLEAVAIGEAIEAAYKPKAEKQRAAGGGDKKSPVAKSVPGNSRKRSSKEREAATTTAVAAAAVGMDRRTYEKADAGDDHVRRGRGLRGQAARG